MKWPVHWQSKVATFRVSLARVMTSATVPIELSISQIDGDRDELIAFLVSTHRQAADMRQSLRTTINDAGLNVALQQELQQINLHPHRPASTAASTAKTTAASISNVNQPANESQTAPPTTTQDQTLRQDAGSNARDALNQLLQGQTSPSKSPEISSLEFRPSDQDGVTEVAPPAQAKRKKRSVKDWLLIVAIIVGGTGVVGAIEYVYLFKSTPSLGNIPIKEFESADQELVDLKRAFDALKLDHNELEIRYKQLQIRYESLDEKHRKTIDGMRSVLQ